MLVFAMFGTRQIAQAIVFLLGLWVLSVVEGFKG